MAENSKIEWCDHTFNPWEGCTKVSPGCANCYAEALRDLRYGAVKWGKGQPRRRTSEANWKKPVYWNRQPWKQCPACGHRWPGQYHECPLCLTVGISARPRVFCASLADWLDDEVPVEWFADLLELILATPNLDWLLLTKRPENWAGRIRQATQHIADSAERMMPRSHGDLERWEKGIPIKNVWIGTTVEDQVRADERIPQLLRIPARVRFLSCEPLLGPVNLRLGECTIIGRDHSTPDHDSIAVARDEQIHWVIAGGESGHGARPMHPDWARSLRDQCAAAGVPFLFKQWGEYCPAEGRPEAQTHIHRWPDNTSMVKAGKKSAGRILDAVEHNGFPEVKP